MEKLTIEQKAQRYDEILVKLQEAKVDNNVCDDRYCCVIDDIVPELAESNDERIRKALVDYFNDFHLQTFAGLDPKKILAWLEKQSENHIVNNNEMVKPADKIEQKFKDNDWVVIGSEVLHIIEVTDNGYITDEGGLIPFRYNKEAHIWSIADAKEGDVLVDMCDSLDNPLIFILKDCKHIKHEFSTLSDYHSFCYLKASKKQEFCIDGWHNEHNLMPATKEQRDLLFQKMHEAGYEWDAEKKELKKTEQKPILDVEIPFGAKDSELIEVTYHIPKGYHAEIEDNKVVIKKGEKKPTDLPNGEDYGIDGLWHAISILERTYGKVDGYQTDDGILEHECAISAVKKLYEQKPAEWNEEDEDMLYKAIAVINKLCAEGKEYVWSINTLKTLFYWLKSLKDRVRPQLRQEWSKEDERIYQSIMDDTVQENQLGDEQKNWLKDIKYRYFPQPKQQWKPSDKQMRALNVINITGCVSYAGQAQELVDLYNELKKLKG